MGTCVSRRNDGPGKPVRQSTTAIVPSRSPHDDGVTRLQVRTLFLEVVGKGARKRLAELRTLLPNARFIGIVSGKIGVTPQMASRRAYDAFVVLTPKS